MNGDRILYPLVSCPLVFLFWPSDEVNVHNSWPVCRASLMAACSSWIAEACDGSPLGLANTTSMRSGLPCRFNGWSGCDAGMYRTTES